MLYLINVYYNYRRNLYYVLYDDVENDISTYSGKAILNLIRGNSKIQGIGIVINKVGLRIDGFKVEKVCSLEDLTIVNLDKYLYNELDNNVRQHNSYYVRLNKPIRIHKNIVKGLLIGYKSLILYKDYDGIWQIFYNNSSMNRIGTFYDEPTKEYISDVVDFLNLLEKKEKVNVNFVLQSITNLMLNDLTILTKNRFITMHITIKGSVVNIDFGYTNLKNSSLRILNINQQRGLLGFLDFSNYYNDIDTNCPVPDVKFIEGNTIIFCNENTKRFVKRLSFVNNLVYLGKVHRNNRYVEANSLKAKYCLLKGISSKDKFLVYVE